MDDVQQSLIARLGPVHEARVRVLCFPQAGGGTATFRPLAATVPSWIDMCAVRLPGRENRRREAPIRKLDQLIGALVTALDDHRDLPLALFGYCSGAFVAFELARLLTRTGGPVPVCLIACASPGPQAVDRNRGVHRKSYSDLLDYLRQYDITPESILADESIFRIFEPSIRADFELFESEPYRPGPLLDLPIAAIGARDDPGVDFAELLPWRELTSQEFALRVLPGGHDFVTTATVALGRSLARELLVHGA